LEKLYIILPVYNRIDLTLKFIESLSQQTYTDYTLLLIDDGSSDGTSDKVKEKLKNTVVIKGEGDWWWAGCIQKGYDWLKNNASENSYVLVINDDLTFEKNFLEKGLSYVAKNENSFILAAAYNQDEPEILEDCGVIYNFKKATINSCDLSKLDELNCLSTRGLFMKTEDFIRTKGFKPHLLPHYYSDYEFTMRAKRKYGIELKCYLDLKVFMNTKTTGVEEISFKTLKEYFSKAFSKRYKENPKYTFTYFLIAFPFPYNLKFSFKQIVDFLRIFRSLIFK
jgi:GT2 family glycosyltransferase